RNAEKANRVYAAIDAHDVYVGATAAADRSQMNVTFRLASPDLEDRFLEGAAARGLVGLKGHRSVGGIRASVYNACDDAAIGALVDFMEAFASESA
ncbi:MAG: 3-phosphoserine/phosphohydroxythreonine transaminase, partial [Bacteroidetes bacterium]|nr:3-phosphoserine/phosphohydroxythreonine transaminase [Bacteroidota bacterium]